MGAVTPIGNDVETFWSNLLAGTPGGGPITTFDTTAHDVKIAAEVKGFDPLVHMDRKMARRMSRFIHFGVAAAAEADSWRRPTTVAEYVRTEQSLHSTIG